MQNLRFHSRPTCFFKSPRGVTGTLKLKKYCSRVFLAFKKITKELDKGMGVEGESLIGFVLLMSWQDEEKEKAAMGPLLREEARGRQGWS